MLCDFYIPAFMTECRVKRGAKRKKDLLIKILNNKMKGLYVLKALQVNRIRVLILKGRQWRTTRTRSYDFLQNKVPLFYM